MSIASIVLLSISIVVLIWGIDAYNKLVKRKTLMDEAWSIVDVFLKKRYDLIPNLVESVKGYATHEKETLEAVINARNKAMGATNMSSRLDSENVLEGYLGRLMAISENYPVLRTNENFMHLQRELAKLEDEVERSRRYFNGTVRENNIGVKVFPVSIIAGMFNFKEGVFYEIRDKKERDAPQVSFND